AIVGAAQNRAVGGLDAEHAQARVDPLPEPRQAGLDPHDARARPDADAARAEVLVDALRAGRAELAPVARAGVLVARHDLVRVDPQLLPQEVAVVEERRGLGLVPEVPGDVDDADAAVDADLPFELQRRLDHARPRDDPAVDPVDGDALGRERRVPA